MSLLRLIYKDRMVSVLDSPRSCPFAVREARRPLCELLYRVAHVARTDFVFIQKVFQVYQQPW